MSKYFDNASTTFVSSEVADKIADIFKSTNGNPSSLHSLGLESELLIKSSAEHLAKLINCDQQEIIFTSGGTESNNLAILGACDRLKRRGTKIITSSVEHSSVFSCFEHLNNNGFKNIFINPNQSNQSSQSSQSSQSWQSDKIGLINNNKIIERIDDDTIFVSLMLSNNETGAINEIKRLVSKIKKLSSKIIVHCDGVSSLGKIKINVKDLGVDLMSFSGHKIHAPKGIGALYIKKGVHINPILFGGLQQNKIRPGTQSVPLIGGFGTACQIASLKINENIKHYKNLNLILRRELSENKNITFNSGNLSDFQNDFDIFDFYNPALINISTNVIRSEILMHFLEEKGFFVSSGSACSKGAKSRVLTNCGLDNKKIDSAIRISFSNENTEKETSDLGKAIIDGVRILKSNY